MGFALGAAEVGRAFQRVVEKVGGVPSTGVLSADDAPDNSGGIVADQMTLQVRVGVPVA